MTRFLDGPAAGVVLLLRRSPRCLRVVCGPDGPTQAGTWDALDQVTDQPRPDERIVVYELQGEPTWCHINRGRHGSGIFRGGTYRLVDPQPTDDQVRSTRAWQAWAIKRHVPPIEQDDARQEGAGR